MDLKEVDILGADINNHWYYQSKARAVKKLLDNKNYGTIVDVGAGSGFFSKELLKESSAKSAWCVDISYTSESDDTTSNKPIHYRQSIDSIDANTVLLMDVLEHVDDDHELLSSYVQKVPEGTAFIISVPAFEFLWSNHDEFLDHKRRYTINRLANVTRRSGLKIERSCYFYGAIFPLAATIRLVKNIFTKKSAPKSELKKHHPLVNTSLKAACFMELPLMKLNRLAGLTVFCLARKTN